MKLFRQGDATKIGETEVNLKTELIESVKNSSTYKNILEKFPDAELVDVKINKKIDKND